MRTAVVAGDAPVTESSVADPAVDIAAVFTWLNQLDIEHLDNESLTDAMCATRPLRGWLDVIDARIRARDRQLRDRSTTHAAADADAGGDAAPALQPPSFDRRPIANYWSIDNAIDGAAGVTTTEARRRAGRSVVIERFPELAALLTAGRVTNEHVEIIARTLDGLSAEVDAAVDANRAEIISAASRLDCVLLRRALARLVNRLGAQLGVDSPRTRSAACTLRLWHDRTTGHGKLYGQFDPDSYQRLSAIIDARARAIVTNGDQQAVDREALGAQALLQLLGAAVDTDPSPPGRHTPARRRKRSASGELDTRVTASISVIVDADTLMRGVHANSVFEYADGTPIDWGYLRQLACTADLIPIVIGGGGSVPLDVGRRRRLATDGQHRALEAIYATCAIGGCEVPVTRCELHHIDHWENGGTTDLDNLVPLCSDHHHRLHEQRWKLMLGDDRSLQVQTPDGAVFATVPDRLIRAGP